MPRPTPKELKLLALHDKMMRTIERPYAVAIAREKNRYVRAVATGFDVVVGVPAGELVIHIDNMFKILEYYNVKAIRVFALYFQTTKGGIKSNNRIETKQTEFESFVNGLFNYWIMNETANDAKETAETTQDDIKKAVAAAQASGETSSAQIAKKILRARGLSAFRAATIARTETHNAAMYATKESARKLQTDTGAALNKKWIPVQDSRTRDIHRQMSSHDIIPLDSKFSVGGALMDRPGDPAGGAKNVIRCRCTMSFEVV